MATKCLLDSLKAQSSISCPCMHQQPLFTLSITLHPSLPLTQAAAKCGLVESLMDLVKEAVDPSSVNVTMDSLEAVTYLMQRMMVRVCPCTCFNVWKRACWVLSFYVCSLCALVLAGIACY